MCSRRRSRFVPWGTSHRHASENPTGSNESLFEHREGVNEMPHQVDPAELITSRAIIQSVLRQGGFHIQALDHVNNDTQENILHERLQTTGSPGYDIHRMSSENLMERSSRDDLIQNVPERVSIGGLSDRTLQANLSESRNLLDTMSNENLFTSHSGVALAQRTQHGNISNGSLPARGPSCGNFPETAWRGQLSRSSSILSSYSGLSMKSQTSDVVKQFYPNYEWTFSDMDTHAIVQRDFRFITITPSASLEDDRASKTSTNKHQHQWTPDECDYLVKAMSKALAVKALDGAMEELMGVAKRCPYSLGEGLYDMDQTRPRTHYTGRGKLFDTFKKKHSEGGNKRFTLANDTDKQRCQPTTSSPTRQTIDLAIQDTADNRSNCSSEILDFTFRSQYDNTTVTHKQDLEEESSQPHLRKMDTSQVYKMTPSAQEEIIKQLDYCSRCRHSGLTHREKRPKNKSEKSRKLSAGISRWKGDCGNPTKESLSDEYGRLPLASSHRVNKKPSKQDNIFFADADPSFRHDPAIYRGHSVHRVTDYFDCRPSRPTAKGRSLGKLTENGLHLRSGQFNNRKMVDGSRRSDDGQRIKKYIEHGSIVLDFTPRRAR